MASWQQQGLIDAPVERVWSLISDPASYPTWAGDSIAVTGPPTKVEKGTTFEQISSTPLWGEQTTTFAVVELDDLHEIKLQCQRSGYYSHWKLTEAQGQTFADVEIGVEPIGLHGQVARVLFTKRQVREITDASLDGLRRAATVPEGPGTGTET